MASLRLPSAHRCVSPWLTRPASLEQSKTRAPSPELPLPPAAACHRTDLSISRRSRWREQYFSLVSNHFHNPTPSFLGISRSLESAAIRPGVPKCPTQLSRPPPSSTGPQPPKNTPKPPNEQTMSFIINYLTLERTRNEQRSNSDRTTFQQPFSRTGLQPDSTRTPPLPSRPNPTPAPTPDPTMPTSTQFMPDPSCIVRTSALL